MKEIKICICNQKKCIINIDANCKAMKDGKIHRAIILEEFTHSTPKPGDPVRYKGDNNYKIVTIIENSAWITKDGVSSLKASPGEWEAVRTPKRGDWIMVSRNGEKYKPRLFFAYTYDKSGVFAIDDEICWSRWRFMTSEDYRAIYGEGK